MTSRINNIFLPFYPETFEKCSILPALLAL
jgi:hypothetical protein